MNAEDWLQRIGSIPDPAKRRGVPQAPAQLPAERSMTRTERRRRELALAALAVLWIVLPLARMGFRGDVTSWPVLLQIGVWTLVLVAAIAAALRPDPRGVPRSLRTVQIAALAVSVAFGALALAFGDGGPTTAAELAPCLLISLAMSVGPLVFATLAMQRTLLAAPVWRGAAVGAACGLAGSIGIQAHCPSQVTMHVLLAHGAPVAVGAILGAILGATRGRV